MKQSAQASKRIRNRDKTPAVSVIMPAYAASRYIDTAVGSVLSQTYDNYELIVVNDGSPDTDELEQVLAPYLDRIVYIKQENRGCSAARNRAIQAARGHFVALLDADDYWEPGFLAEQMRFIEENPGVDLVYADGMHVGDSPLAGRTFMETSPSTGEVTLESLLLGRCTVLLSGVVARRKAVIEAGMFDEGLRYAEDYDLWLRMSCRGARLAYQRKVLLSKRMHDTNLSANHIKLFESALGVLEKTARNNELSQSERAALEQGQETLKAVLKLERGKLKFCAGDYSAAAEEIERANEFYKSWRLRFMLFGLRFAPWLLLLVYRMRMQITVNSKGVVGAFEKNSSFTVRAAWLLIAKTLAFVLSFALPLLLVRRLSQHEFGLYKQVFLIVATALNVMPLGFQMSAYYFLPREFDQKKTIVFNILLFNIAVGLLACLALVLFPSSLTAIFNSAELVDYAVPIGIVIFLWVVSSFLESIAIANQELKLATVLIISANFSKTFLLLLAAVFIGTVESLIYVAIIHGSLQMVILLVYMRSRFPAFWRTFDFVLMWKQMGYALPFGVAAIFYSIQLDLHHYFVANRFDAAEYAIYAVGCLNLPIVGILTESIGGVMIPRASYLQKQDQTREIILLTARVMRKLAVIYFALYAFLMVSGREFISVLFTEQYAASWPIFAINLTLLPLHVLMTDPIMRAYTEHRYFLLKVGAVLLVLLLTALYFASQRLGLVGVITVVVGVSVVGRLITIIKVGKILGVARRDVRLLKDPAKIGVAAALAGVLTAIIRSYAEGSSPVVVLSLAALSFVIFYLWALLLLRVLTPEERDSIRHQFTRLRRRSWRREAVPLAE